MSVRCREELPPSLASAVNLQGGNRQCDKNAGHDGSHSSMGVRWETHETTVGIGYNVWSSEKETTQR